MIFKNKRDISVFRVIKKRAMSVTEIGERLNIPRTSVQVILNRLKSEGLVVDTPSPQKGFLWSQEKEDVLLEKVKTIKKYIAGGKKKQQAPSNIFSDVIIHTNKKDILESLKRLYAENQGKRVYSIQSFEMFHWWIDFFGESEVFLLETLLKKKNIIFICLRDLRFKTIFTKNKHSLESFLGRTTDTRLLPSSYFEKNTASFIGEKSTLYFDIEKGFCVEFKSKTQASFSRKLFLSMHEKGEKIDIHKDFRPA